MLDPLDRSSQRATPDDLHRLEGQAELIGGRIVRLPLHSVRQGLAIIEITSSLYHFADVLGKGEVYTSTLAYIVPVLSSGRESFSPDCSYYLGLLPENPMEFVRGAPTFAVEVRDEAHEEPSDKPTIAAKRADYFEAGTLVVWDVDPEAEVVRVFRASDPENPASYGRGQDAEAEPAVPGWRLAVDAMFGVS